MRKKSKEVVINLRGQKFTDLSDLQKQVELFLDKQLTPYLQISNLPKITIIVGRGLNSARFIEGKNPLRFYCENYLIKLGFKTSSISNNPGAIEILG